MYAHVLAILGNFVVCWQFTRLCIIPLFDRRADRDFLVAPSLVWFDPFFGDTRAPDQPSLSELYDFVSELYCFVSDLKERSMLSINTWPKSKLNVNLNAHENFELTCEVFTGNGSHAPASSGC